MHKRAGIVDVPFAYALYVEQDDGSFVPLVMDGCLPVFVDLDSTNLFIRSVVDKHISSEVKIIIKKIIIQEYVEDEGQSDRTSKSKTKKTKQGGNKRNRKN